MICLLTSLASRIACSGLDSKPTALQHAVQLVWGFLHYG